MQIIKKLKDRFKYRVLALALRGKNVTCPCCNHSFITFLPGGVVNKKANVKCPYCYSNERTRSLALYLKMNPSMFFDSMNLMHAAPEHVFGKWFSKMKINYIPTDIEPARYGAKTIKADVTDLQFDDEFFDGIICCHVLEHVPDDIKAMQEMYRCLKKDGWAILNVPVSPKPGLKTYEDFSITDPKERLKHFGQEDHVRIYGADYYDRLKSVGFQVEIIDLYKSLKGNDAFKYGLKEKDVIVLAKKITTTK